MCGPWAVSRCTSSDWCVASLHMINRSVIFCIHWYLVWRARHLSDHRTHLSINREMFLDIAQLSGTRGPYNCLCAENAGFRIPFHVFSAPLEGTKNACWPSQLFYLPQLLSIYSIVTGLVGVWDDRESSSILKGCICPIIRRWRFAAIEDPNGGNGAITIQMMPASQECAEPARY